MSFIDSADEKARDAISSRRLSYLSVRVRVRVRGRPARSAAETQAEKLQIGMSQTWLVPHQKDILREPVKRWEPSDCPAFLRDIVRIVRTLNDC
jgi:hypothetical protein